MTISSADADAIRARLTAVARAEHRRLQVAQRGDAVLREAIAGYFNFLHLPLPPRSEIDCYHYSAVFMSWCMRRAGVSAADFPTTQSHWSYTRMGLAAPPGALIRTRRMDEVAPRPGDIVNFNRDGNRYDFAAVGSGYPSESGIVVSVDRAGRTLAVVIGNDQAGTIGAGSLALSEAGMLVQRTVDPVICVVTLGA